MSEPTISIAAYPARWADITPDLLATLGPMGRMAWGGLSICPIASDGTKRAIGRWQGYQTRIPNPLQVAGWVRRGLGYAIICGTVSGGLEGIDFDDGKLYVPWYQQCYAIIEKHDLPIVATPSRGYHIYYRCSEIGRNAKLAKRAKGEPRPAGKDDTLIETRGQGGYVLGPNNPRCVHPTGRLYLQMGGVELPSVPSITPDERRHLLRAAIAYDRSGLREKAIQEQAKRLRAEQWRQSHAHQDSGFRVGDDYRARATWPEVLEPHGWTYAGGTFWTRPGGDRGAHSASVNEATGGASVLVVFSSNAGPLAPSTGDHATWDLFSAYAALNHSGNRQAAAKELRTKGYGG